MAHSRSARKRIRQNAAHNLQNRTHLSALRTQLKKMRQALVSRDLGRAQAEYKTTTRTLDKAATKGVIHRNEAARHKSRFARQLAALSTAAPAST